MSSFPIVINLFSKVIPLNLFSYYFCVLQNFFSPISITNKLAVCSRLHEYINLVQIKSLNLKIVGTEAITQRCSVKKIFLEISQNSQENTCARVSFLIKLQAYEFCEISKNIFHYKTPRGDCFCR